MPRLGLELEQTIAKLEKLLSGGDIEIIQGARIPDYVAGGTREIDVLLKAKVGTHELLIILECRDRKATSDVNWIEQLIMKRNGVKAHKAVAISASKFSKKATRLAREYNIALRNLKHLTLSDIASWSSTDTITIKTFPSVKFLKARCTVEGYVAKSDELIDQLEAGIKNALSNPTEAHLYNSRTNHKISISEIWNFYAKNNRNDIDMWTEEIQATGQAVTRELEQSIVDPIHIPGIIECRITHFRFIVAMKQEVKRISPKQIVRYTEGDNVLCESLQFEFDIEGKHVSLDIVKNKDIITFSVESDPALSFTFEDE